MYLLKDKKKPVQIRASMQEIKIKNYKSHMRNINVAKKLEFVESRKNIKKNNKVLRFFLVLKKL